jgi:putative ABC transport system permease protein
MAEFATLKAMGYGNPWLLRVVVAEAVFLALLGYAAGLALASLAFRAIHDSTGLPMLLKPADAGRILALTLAMCTLAGLLAARKLVATDPADLYA